MIKYVHYIRGEIKTILSKFIWLIVKILKVWPQMRLRVDKDSFGHHCSKVTLPYIQQTSTECVRELDKLNLVKLGYGGSLLGLSQFLLLSQVAQKMTLALKVVKSDSEIIIPS